MRAHALTVITNTPARHGRVFRSFPCFGIAHARTSQEPLQFLHVAQTVGRGAFRHALDGVHVVVGGGDDCKVRSQVIVARHGQRSREAAHLPHGRRRRRVRRRRRKGRDGGDIAPEPKCQKDESELGHDGDDDDSGHAKRQ